ncbi:MAG TPA: aromatic-ring-hydroxylating dioxygenase subunit beta [Stellaceae bacterium]|nr:aromatic-ring-hydroxylating dioxygenase subunit beta [Stellaceae bacterium]
MTAAPSLELRLAIEDLNSAYCAALDDGRYEEWPELFAEDCLYRIVPRDNYERDLPIALMHCESKGMLKDRVIAVRQTAFYLPRFLRHIVSGIRSTVEADGTIRSTANYLVVQTLPEQPTELFNSGRYLDVILREEGGLRFKERLCVFDSIVVPNSLVVPI